MRISDWSSDVCSSDLIGCVRPGRKREADMALTYHDKLLLGCAAVLALGMVGGGYLLGDGLKRAMAADRSVTVRGLAEKDVTADLATWSISYSAPGFDLPAVRAEIDNNTRELRAYFASLGFKPDALTATGAGVHQYIHNGVNTITITQRMLLRTTDKIGRESCRERVCQYV